MAGRGHRYAEGINWEAGTSVWEGVLRDSGVSARSTVGEIGAGPALLSAACVRLGASAISVDWSYEMLSAAPLRASRSAVVGDATALPLREGCVDAVVGRSVLWCLPAPSRVVRECLRVLGGRGLIVFAEPVFEAANERAQRADAVARLQARRRELLGKEADDVNRVEAELVSAAAAQESWHRELQARGFDVAARLMTGLAVAGGPDRYYILIARRDGDR